jgi:hypothetical protein
MNQIAQIVKAVLEANDGKSLDNEKERQIVANEVASKLTSASLVQLADLLGGSVEHDNDGQIVIYTGIHEC